MGEFLPAEGEAAPDAAIESDSAAIAVALGGARSRRADKADAEAARLDLTPAERAELATQKA